MIQERPNTHCVRVGASSLNVKNISFVSIQQGRSRQDGRNTVFLCNVNFTSGVRVELEGKSQAAAEACRDFLEAAMNGEIDHTRGEHIFEFDEEGD